MDNPHPGGVLPPWQGIIVRWPTTPKGRRMERRRLNTVAISKHLRMPPSSTASRISITRPSIVFAMDPNEQPTRGRPHDVIGLSVCDGAHQAPAPPVFSESNVSEGARGSIFAARSESLIDWTVRHPKDIQDTWMAFLQSMPGLPASCALRTRASQSSMHA